MNRLMAIGLLACAGTAMADEPLVFHASATVSVSAAGEVTSVEPDQSLSPALQKLVRDEVSRYRFEPPTHDGRAVEGTTYVRLGGCAAPDDNGYRVSLAYKGAGPLVEGGQLPPPRYPELAYRTDAEADAKVTYVVEPDGSVTLESIAYVREPRAKRAFDQTLREWVQRLRYEPEILGGKPVRTTLEVPVDFRLGPADPRALVKETKERRLSSPECTAATSQERLEPVVVDSPFRRLPSS